MPQPEQVVAAINTVLDGCGFDTIENLDTDVRIVDVSCFDFGPAVLAKLLELLGVDPADPVGDIPTPLANGTFMNIAMMGEPSRLNHNLNAFVWGDTTYVIQAFVNFDVRLVTPFPNDGFIQRWQELATPGWPQAYQALFGVNVADVLQQGGAVIPAPAQWPTERWVTIVGPELQG